MGAMVTMTIAVKHDAGKERWDLLPYGALGDVAKVMTHGATKYGDRNWEGGISQQRLMAAMMRHIAAWACGVTHDEESGLPHLAHASANALMLLSVVRVGYAPPSAESVAPLRRPAAWDNDASARLK